jgi:hypothetical protein
VTRQSDRIEEKLGHLHELLHEIRFGVRYLVAMSRQADADEQRKLNQAYDEATAITKKADDALEK